MSIFNDPQYYPGGFVVDSRIVNITYAHPGSFIPAYATTEWTIWGDEGVAMSYWDQKAYAIEYGGSQHSIPIEPNITNSTSIYEIESKSRKESPAKEPKESIAVPDIKRSISTFL